MKTASPLTRVPARRSRLTAALLASLLLATIATQAQTNPESSAPTKKEAIASLHATGPFDVKIVPQAADESTGPAIGRFLIDKQFHGDLEASSKGWMLAASTGVKGSAGYVALELVIGTLKGRTGTFVLQHSATMDRGVPTLSITVVPDSGTGQLTGLTGKMNIIITDGKHSYDFEYTLPETP